MNKIITKTTIATLCPLLFAGTWQTHLQDLFRPQAAIRSIRPF